MNRHILKAKRAAAIAAAGVMSAGMIIPFGTAFAAGAYTPIDGDTFTFNKVLTADAGTPLPSVTFPFTIASGTAIAGDATHMDVFAGPLGSGQTAASVTQDTGFSASDVGTTTKTCTVNLNGVEFTEPGIYRYVITEQALATPVPGVTNDTNTQRWLDVTVVDNNGALQVSGYTLYSTNPGAIEIVDDNGTITGVPEDADPDDDKSEGFTNALQSDSLTVSKTVTGNQGSHDTPFTFTITVPSADTNATYNVTYGGGGASQTGNGATVSGSALASGATFKLAHGDSLTIAGLPDNAKYIVSENKGNYSCSINGTADADASTPTAAAEQYSLDDVSTVAFTNNREGAVPTGIIIPMAGGLIVAGGAGLGLVANKRRREEEE